MAFFGDDRVLKERSRTLAVRIAGNDQHAFEGADVAHRFARFGQRRSALPSFEMTLQIGITDAGVASGRKREHNSQNDEAATLGGVEYAAAVGEAAGFMAQFAYLALFQVQHQARFDCFGNFLPVVSDVLHRSSTYASGNAAQTLDSRASGPHRVRDKPVPGFARTGVEENFAVVVGLAAAVNACDGDS